MVNRRAFMKSGALALFASGIGGMPNFIAEAAGSNKIWTPYKKNKVLVCIFQRGARLEMRLAKEVAGREQLSYFKFQ